MITVGVLSMETGRISCDLAKEATVRLHNFLEQLCSAHFDYIGEYIILCCARVFFNSSMVEHQFLLLTKLIIKNVAYMRRYFCDNDNLLIII